VNGKVLVRTERYSDSINLLHFSDESVLWGCTWPGCNYVSENPKSIPAHYKTHAGQAAQRRRSQRRPRSAEVTNEALEAALSALDAVQNLVDKLDSFESEYRDVVARLAEAEITIEGLRTEHEDQARKAAAFDAIQEALRGATS
jgi:hypothetical protein